MTEAVERDELAAGSRALEAQVRGPEWSGLLRGALAEAGLTLLTAVSAAALFLWRIQWWGNDQTLPPLYFGDPLQAGNMVFNAQHGDVFLSRTFGAPLGQQLGLSAYGIEWPQSVLAAALAGVEHGPWLAINRYMVLTYVLAAACGYLGARLAGATRWLSILAGLAFSLMPVHLVLSLSWFTLGNYASTALFLGAAVRLAKGHPLADLLPGLTELSRGWRHAISGAAVLGMLAVSVSGGNYYMWFNGLFVLAFGGVLAGRRRFWPRTLRIWALGAAQLFVIVAIIAPVYVARARAGLPMSEPATGDRRAFAALVNGGELISAFLPSTDSFSHRLLERLPSFAAFAREYDTSSAIFAEDYQGGLVVPLALVVIILWLLGTFRSHDFLRRTSTAPTGFLAATLALLVTSAIFLRGAFGLFLAFAFPTLRAYDRAIVMVAFAAVLVVVLVAGAKDHVRRGLRILLTAALCLVIADFVSGNAPPGPSGIFSGSVAPGPIDRAASSTRDLGVGVELRTPGPAATEQLVLAASRQLAPGCSVLVFPIVTYPVDFTIGVESYVGYDTLKPGLVDSDLKWTPGSLPGTPNAAWNEALVQLYRSHDYAGAIALAERQGACGALLMSSLQDVIATASGTTGTPHGAAADIRGALEQEYGAACYTDAESAVELYCGRPDA